MIRGDEIEFHNFSLKIAASECRLSRVVFALVRNMSSSDIQGVKMDHLNIQVLSNLHYQQPEVVQIFGNASAVAGEKWFINISDTEGTKFVISANVTDPSAANVSSKSFVFIRLPFMKMDLQGKSIWFTDKFENNYTSTMEWLHCTTNRLVPVLRIEINDFMEKYSECVYYGTLRWQMHLWSPSYSSFYLNPSLNVTNIPMIFDSESMVIAFRMGDKKISTKINFMKEFRSRLTIFSLFDKNVTVCVPQIAMVEGRVETPFWESSHNGYIGEGQYYLRSNVNISVLLPLSVMRAKIMNVTNVINFNTSKNDLLVGGIYSNGSLYTPLTLPYNASFIVSETYESSKNVTRKVDFIQQLGDNQPIMFNISGPLMLGDRRLVMQALGEKILTASIFNKKCAFPLPLLPDLLCVPQNLQIKNITADIPVAQILQELDVLNLTVPETRWFDIRLRNSSVSVVTQKQKNHWNVTAQIKLISPVVTKSIEDELPEVLRVPLERLESTKFDVINMTFSVAKTAQGIGTALDTVMLTPW